MNIFKKCAITVANKVSKHSPEILLVTGIVGVVGTVVVACMETRKLDKIVQEAHEELDRIDLKVLPKKSDSLKVYIKTGAKIARNYAPAVALGSVSIGCLVGSHYILNKRYVGALAAYSILDDSFRKYRKRIAEKFGDEVEKNLYLGLDENGEVSKNDEKSDRDVLLSPTDGVIISKRPYSPYAVFFDETCSGWEKNAEFNKLTLTCLQNLANDRLTARGHLFLNEVYDMIGVPRTQAGAVVGWIKHGDGDGYVDFGLRNQYNEKVRDFVNGYERSILLDFNVDGIIYDKI